MDQFLRVGEFNARMDSLDEKIALMLEKQDKTNGTVARHELRVSRLEWGVSLLKWAFGLGVLVYLKWRFGA